MTDVAEVRSRDPGLETLDDARASTAWLEQRLRSADRVSVLARLASIVAHELGTPLNVIAGRAGLIGDEPDASSFARKNASIIGEQVRSITDLLQRIVDVARRHGLDEKRVLVHTVAEKAVVLLAPLAEQMKVSLSAEGDRTLAACIDELRTLQVLTTLMVNGIAAMPSGGQMRLCVGAVELSAPPDARCAPGPYLTIAVIDQGAGIPREKLPRLFEPFYAEGHEGGLGLMVCQSILREQGGLLTVESEPSVGSTFTMHLPLGR